MRAQDWRREAAEEMGGPLDGGTPLPPDTMLQREGSGPLGPVPVAAVDAYPKNQSFCRVCGKLPK